MLTRLAALLPSLALSFFGACKGASPKEQAPGSAPAAAQPADAIADQHPTPTVVVLPAELTAFGTLLDSLLEAPSPEARSRKACTHAEELFGKARATRNAPIPAGADADEWRLIVSDILEDFAEALWADCADAPDDQHEKLDKMKSGFDRLAALAGHTAPAPPPH